MFWGRHDYFIHFSKGVDEILIPEEIEILEPFEWDVTRIQLIANLSIEVSFVLVFTAAMTGFVISKFIKIMIGRG